MHVDDKRSQTKNITDSDEPQVNPSRRPATPRLHLPLLLVSLLGIATGCRDTSLPKGPVPTRIELSPRSVLLTGEAGSHALTAQAFDADGKPMAYNTAKSNLGGRPQAQQADRDEDAS